jgi:hypothetical protein
MTLKIGWNVLLNMRIEGMRCLEAINLENV